MRYILTGTPGSGKTSIITELGLKGYCIIQEAATDVINEEQKSGNLEPWKLPDFVEKIVQVQKLRQLEAEKFSSALQFFDRSPICTYALSLYLNFPPPSALIEEIERVQKNNIYEKRVFFIENLGFITNSDARKISFEEALRFEQIHIAAYKKFGHECMIIPFLPVAERLKIIHLSL
jgi:predicted ATPase